MNGQHSYTTGSVAGDSLTYPFLFLPTYLCAHLTQINQFYTDQGTA